MIFVVIFSLLLIGLLIFSIRANMTEMVPYVSNGIMMVGVFQCSRCRGVCRRPGKYCNYCGKRVKRYSKQHGWHPIMKEE